MASLRTAMRSEAALLAGDAALLTAALFGAGTGVFALAVAPTGGADQDVPWVWQLLSVVLMVGAVVVGPVSAWILHGRRLSWAAVIGGVLGGFLASMLLGAATMLLVGVGVTVSAITGSELAGPITTLALAGLVLLALAVWLARDAVRDLAPERRAHPRLDVVRLVAIGLVAVVAVGSLVWSATHPGDESAELIAFALGTGLLGAVIALGAEAGATVWAGRAARARTG